MKNPYSLPETKEELDAFYKDPVTWFKSALKIQWDKEILVKKVSVLFKDGASLEDKNSLVALLYTALHVMYKERAELAELLTNLNTPCVEDFPDW